VTTPEVAGVLTKALHFNTFGGNPVCSAGGHAVLKVVDREKLQENSILVGEHLLAQLRNLQEKHSSKNLVFTFHSFLGRIQYFSLSFRMYQKIIEVNCSLFLFGSHPLVLLHSLECRRTTSLVLIFYMYRFLS
jgi:hypothetical protein